MGLEIGQLRTVSTMGNAEAVALAVEEGLGVGFVSQFVISRLVAGRVATVRVRGLNMQQDVFIGRNTTLPGTTAQDAFWTFVTCSDSPVLAELVGYGFIATC